MYHDFYGGYSVPRFVPFQVCGFPLVTNVFVPTGEYCLVSQKKCLRHYCWAKLRRAEIDMERVRQVSIGFAWQYGLERSKLNLGG